MSSLRLKIQYSEETSGQRNQKPELVLKFIYVVETSSQKTVDELIRALQKHINQQLSTYNTQIVQLITADGFALSKSDICSHVLNDNDYLMCIDMKKCARDNFLTITLEKAWLEIKAHDLCDNHEKSIHIGLNSFRKLYIRLRGTTSLYGICIFDVHELIKIASEKRKDNLIARIDDTDDYNETSSSEWFLECRWDFDTASNNNLYIICNLKIGSADNVVSDKLHLILDHTRMRIEKGEITHLSNPDDNGLTLTDEQRQRLKELAANLPPPKRTGSQIDTTVNQNLKVTEHECEGESSIRMACGNTNIVETFQEQRSPGTPIVCQHVTVTHIIFSKKSTVLPEILNQKRSQPVEKAVSVAGLTLLYQTHEGAWRECQDVAIAPIPIRNEEPRWLTDSVINIPPDKLISFTIRGMIAVKGESGADSYARARLHKSLPQPLKLKILVKDSSAKHASLVVEQLNKPLDLTTRESFLDNNASAIKELFAFVYADDTENDERICVAVYLSMKDELVIKTAGTFIGFYDRINIRTMQFNAKKNKTPEIEVDDTVYDHNNKSGKIMMLFDPETYIFYALRLHLGTKTSKTEETVFIPIEKIK